MSATIAIAAFQAFSTIQQGRYQQKMYNLQAQQAELQGRQNALNYSNQALQVLERQRRMSATLVAKGAAAGIDPFSGSPLTVDRYNAFKAGEEYNLGIENADMAIAGGLAQSQSLQAAGKQAMKQAYFNAAVSMAQGVYSSAQTATPTATQPSGTPMSNWGQTSYVNNIPVQSYNVQAPVY